MDNEEIKQKLRELLTEHRDLDDVIRRLVDDPTMDQLQLQRLKKRKLLLKDQIVYYEDMLIPDMEA